MGFSADNMLTIAISTFGDRVYFLGGYNFSPSVQYLVLWQNPYDYHLEVPSNVKVVRLTSAGVAISRNHAIKYCETPWVWFMDDDVYIPEESITKVLSLIEKANQTDVFISSVKSPDGAIVKKYDFPQSNKIRSVLNVGTIQIIANIDAIKKSNVKFPINMGAGMENNLCDEPVFLFRLLRNIKNLRFIFPSGVYVVHPVESSGGVYSTPGSIRSRAMLFREIYGFPLCIFASLFFLFKHKRKVGCFWPYLFAYKQAK